MKSLTERIEDGRKDGIEDRITTVLFHSKIKTWDMFDLCAVLNEENEIVEQVLSEMSESEVSLAEQEVL
jgi:hypothetical protein